MIPLVRPISDPGVVKPFRAGNPVVPVATAPKAITVHHSRTYRVDPKDLTKIIPMPCAGSDFLELNFPIGAEAWIKEAEFSWEDGGAFVELGPVEEGRVLRIYAIQTFEPFNDPSTTLTIGWDSETDAIMGARENAPIREGLFVIDADWEFDDDQVVKVFVNCTATTGRGKASIVYFKP